MALTPITPQMLKDAGRIASTPLNPTDLLLVWQNGAMVVVDASDVGGGGGSQSRQVATITTASLAPNTSAVGTVTLGKGYRLLTIDTSSPCRVRIYTNEGDRDADLSRQFGTDRPQGVGLMLEFVSVAGLLAADLSPTVDGFTANGTAYYSVTNRGLNAQIVNVDFDYLPTEI